MNAARARWMVIFAFLLLYGVILSLLRPDPTRAQVLFRAAISATGLIGLLWMVTRRR